MAQVRLAPALLIVLAACAPRPASPPPVPPEARALVETGPHEQRLDLVVRELRDALEPRHGRLEIHAYRVPAGTTWSQIAAHYRTDLAGWRPEPALPQHIRAATAKAWSCPGKVFAVALIDKPVAGEVLDFKILVTAQTELKPK